MLYSTLDGGVRWHLQHLVPPLSSPGGRPTTWSFSHPTFFGDAGVLPALVDQSLTLYLTHDGGATWSPTRPLPDRDLTGPHVVVLDPRHIWAVVGATLFFTPDTGRHWRTLAGHLPLSAWFPVDFVNTGTGFALSGYTDQRRAYLLKTTNGGRTWRRIRTLPSP
jgi:photosystem II stability/assembly factor-like uncharacterized protein